MVRFSIVGVMLLVTITFSNAVFAGNECDGSKVSALADAFLSGVPENGYLVSADDLLKRIQSGKKDFVVVDVREKEAKYKAGHIPGAIYINFKDIAKPESLAKLPKDKDIILYCNTGHEENKAMAVLRLLGYKAYGLKFGYMSWKKAAPTEFTLKMIENADNKKYPVEGIN